MEREMERIIQVSLTKITDCRRRRGGPMLRRSLLVSNVLNNALTSSETSYGHYRTPKDGDVDCDGLEQESVCLERPVLLRDDTGGSGNAHELRNSTNNMDSKVLCERTADNQVTNMNISKEVNPKVLHSSALANCSSGNKESKAVKRPRSHYANDTCENHAVTRKRCRTEQNTTERNTLDAENIEPMDVSGLVNVFSNSLSGLSGFSSKSSNDSFIFSCITPPVNGVYSQPSWQQTVAAF
ncbi:uncharacterized protein LOC116291964 [Actinia tenebrosa]|uniref:Uncharacterized protein LOC116291964 n=1 Tax=Actinia tenebrosa TaxID=6105 RepID=A0A6P8HF70_ACTTE|nr:uncharacterized protein LOC116291964 [Actinia tenebrosa]